MSSEPRRLHALALLAVLAVMALAACGKKGDPLPPPRTIPAATRELTLRQRGLEVVVELPYPKTTTAGLVLPGLDRIEVWRALRPAPPAGQPSPIEPRELTAAGAVFLTLTGPELASAVAGDRLTVRFLLPAPGATAAEAHHYAVRTHASGGEWSDFTNIVALVPKAPPAAPSSLTVEGKAEGVVLGWGAVAGATGFNVYRREAERTSYGPPLAALGAEATSYVDAQARYGQRYIYAVCTVATRAPLVESAPGSEREIDVQDRFAPAPPTGLTALPDPTEVRLTWDSSPAADVAGYRVYRQDPEAEWRLVSGPDLVQRELVDRGLASGMRFRWRVTAVDLRGNEGEPAEVSATTTSP